MRAETSRAATRPAATPWLVAATLALLLLSATMAGGLPSNSPFEGLQVHGHWTIQVTNPDGSPGGMFEFDNDLTSVGDQVLAPLLLAGDPAIYPDGVAGVWYLYVGDRDTLDDPLNGGGVIQGVSPCPAQGFPMDDEFFSFSTGFGSFNISVQSQPDATFMSTGCLLGADIGSWEGTPLEALTPHAPLEGSLPEAGTARLSGTFDALQDGTISHVASWFLTSDSPGGISFGSGSVALLYTQFTAANVTPVEVVAGQQVTVTVDFTFS